MKMNAQYFIDKFEAIPEEKWTEFVQIDNHGKRCALGHFLPSEYRNTKDWINGGYNCGAQTVEGKALTKIFGDAYTIASINNGQYPRYNQPTPKQRILAALRDEQSKEQQNEAVEQVKEVLAQPTGELV